MTKLLYICTYRSLFIPEFQSKNGQVGQSIFICETFKIKTCSLSVHFTELIYITMLQPEVFRENQKTSNYQFPPLCSGNFCVHIYTDITHFPSYRLDHWWILKYHDLELLVLQYILSKFLLYFTTYGLSLSYFTKTK